MASCGEKRRGTKFVLSFWNIIPAILNDFAKRIGIRSFGLGFDEISIYCCNAPIFKYKITVNVADASVVQLVKPLPPNLSVFCCHEFHSGLRQAGRGARFSEMHKLRSALGQ